MACPHHLLRHTFCSFSSIQQRIHETNGRSTRERKDDPFVASETRRSGEECETSKLLGNYEDELLNDYTVQDGVPNQHNNSNEKHVSQRASVISNSMLAIRISKQETRITRVMLVIFVAYCVCWFPAAVVSILAISDLDHIPIEWFYIIVTMVELKCAIDPILYGLGNRNYWNAFMRLLGCG